MNRRQSFEAIAALSAATSLEAAVPEPIQLHVDLEVDPAKEAELLKNFKQTFRPTISKQPGFVDVKLLKLRNAVAGAAPATRYRLLISFQTEEQRLKWVATDDHQRAWPTIERTLSGKKFTAVLYDIQ
ncbi:MAG: antibiotic biosynthesis monooxygenase [Acidobacteria bacterium]|nr:antibiotic biosynthesis monooxygenase [Acidobacteriota bacterium]